MALVNLLVKIQVNKNDYLSLERNEISTDVTWTELLAQNQVQHDPKIHYIRGSVHNALLEEKINEYYRKFGRQMGVYKVSLVRKPSHMIKHEKDLEAAIQRSLQQVRSPSEVVVYSVAPSSSPQAPELDVYEIQQPKRTKLAMNTQRLNLSNVKTFSDLDDIEQELRAMENTQEGNNVAFEEKAITDGIRSHFQSRVSNKDILAVRDEIRHLKRTRNYFHLTRLVSFTAGFLENTFLIDG